MKTSVLTRSSVNNPIKLPLDIQREVEDFALFLLEKRTKKRGKKPSFAWYGALRILKDKYTSVELQHQLSEWRIAQK
jgi:hypothetical protein